MKDNRVIPNCRYGHGNLQHLALRHPETGTELQFSFVGSADSSLKFVGKIYTCSVCGYTEFFDDEPAVTAHTIENAKR
jgi:hypothetical protein